MDRVRQKLASDLPEVSTYFQTGGLVDSVVNQGMPAPIDIQVSGNDQHGGLCGGQRNGAASCARRSDVSDVLIPQDLDYPGLQLNVRREMAARLGLTASDVVNNVVTALTSNGMIAPSYWVDPQERQQLFPYRAVHQPADRFDDHGRLQADSPARPRQRNPTMLENVADIQMINTPTEVDHYQLFRVIDVYVSPKGEDLGSALGRG